MRVGRSLLLLAAVAFAMGFAAWEVAQASNMAFKLNKIIHPLASGGKGRNFVAFPDRGPHSGPGGYTNICAALNLDPNAGEVTQFDAVGGSVNTYRCGQLETFTFLDGVGAIITDPVGAGGIIVGSDIPGNSFDFIDLGMPPIGYNIFPVEYHTTAVTPEDLCDQCGLSSTATLTRFDALDGSVLTHRCTQLPIWDLVLGEALLVLDEQVDPNTIGGPIPLTCTPSHF
jgi:hypothetical protein